LLAADAAFRHPIDFALQLSRVVFGTSTRILFTSAKRSSYKQAETILGAFMKVRSGNAPSLVQEMADVALVLMVCRADIHRVDLTRTEIEEIAGKLRSQIRDAHFILEQIESRLSSDGLLR
jgi:hypothetical protein